MRNIEEDFIEELEVFRKEVYSGIQMFYANMSINAVLGKNKIALDVINETPLLWGTIMHSLQMSCFIVLGRVFDEKSASYSVYRLLKLAERNVTIFEKDALRRRKVAGSDDAAEWIEEYMESVCVPRSSDFRRMRKHVAKYKKMFIKYREIRNNVYAHKVVVTRDDVNELFSVTNVGEMQKIFIFLKRLYDSLWELFNNGKKFVLRRDKRSVSSLLKERPAEWRSNSIQQDIVREAKKLVDTLCRASVTT
jgi:hypothetical protein